MSVLSSESGRDPTPAGPLGESPSPPSEVEPSAPAEAERAGGAAAAAGASARPAAAPTNSSAAELHDRWLRAEAELQNLRRRAAREREETSRSAEDGVLLELITMLDDLDRALDAAREAGAPESWTEGVRLTASRARERLGRFGVVTLDPVGKPFDPRFHEALLEIDAPEGASQGSVVQVVHRGYARGDRALRPARVVVARAPAEGKP